MQTDGDLFRLGHILNSIEKIQELVKRLHSFDNFKINWMEQDALIRNFEIIGEASNHISQAIKDKYSDVAWREMKDMRNFMSHVYFGLQLDSIWDTAINDIPALEKQIREIIADSE